jgi:hypothetical protein
MNGKNSRFIESYVVIINADVFLINEQLTFVSFELTESVTKS